LDFVLTASNGVSTQAGDFGHASDAAAPVLQRHQTSALAPGFFIQGRQQMIDCCVLACDRTVWLRRTL
jgi:hypothetical protein